MPKMMAIPADQGGGNQNRDCRCQCNTVSARCIQPCDLVANRIDQLRTKQQQAERKPACTDQHHPERDSDFGSNLTEGGHDRGQRTNIRNIIRTMCKAKKGHAHNQGQVEEAVDFLFATADQLCAACHEGTDAAQAPTSATIDMTMMVARSGFQIFFSPFIAM